jgi:hypothetical protein
MESRAKQKGLAMRVAWRRWHYVPYRTLCVFLIGNGLTRLPLESFRDAAAGGAQHGVSLSQGHVRRLGAVRSEPIDRIDASVSRSPGGHELAASRFTVTRFNGDQGQSWAGFLEARGLSGD